MTENPTADNGGTGQSQDWIKAKTKARTIKDKIVENGAQVTTLAPEKQRKFIVSFRIKEKSNEDNNNNGNHQHNLATLHQAFMKQFLTVSKGNVHFIPTSKTDNKTDIPITKIEEFPTNDRSHRNFFHRQVSQNDRNKNNTVKIHHTVLMQKTVQEVKKKMLQFLQSNRLWLSGGELDTVETVNIVWLLGAHPQMVN